MIPKNVIKVMKIIIEKKNFSPDMVKMCYQKDRNTFTGSDSFVLFEFQPKAILNIDDFSITYNQLEAIDKLTPEWMLSFWGTHQIWDTKIIECNTDSGGFYLPLLEHKFPRFEQASIFWEKDWVVKWFLANKSFLKFTKAVSILNENQEVDITEKAYVFKMEDDLWKYNLVCRLPVLWEDK